MQKIAIFIICICMFSCTQLDENRGNRILNTEELKNLEESYILELEWDEGQIFDVKLNDKETENGEIFNLKSSEEHKISWVVPSFSLELSIKYETDGSKISSPNTESDISGKIGLNTKKISLTEDSYIFIDGTTFRVLPLTDILLPEKVNKDDDLDIFKINDTNEVKVIDKTESN